MDGSRGHDRNVTENSFHYVRIDYRTRGLFIEFVVLFVLNLLMFDPYVSICFIYMSSF